ncbi:DUF4157 domain-containing protein [Dyella ginsengisoli]|uniref:eCIS core domain-containing protein n=1 Tax=Dyella ginsengisoli TaxID=363848 RepID=UPI000348DB08|nr:DUF4157 domain-containing protein [Dyella ginsengisoli]
MQPRLQVSVPGDAGEREAEHAADAVMAGRTPRVTVRSPASLLQRQDHGSGSPTHPGAPDPSRLEAPHADGDAGTATTGSATAPTAPPPPTCAPTAFSRANYLTQPGTSTDDFGLTRLDINAVVRPSVTTTRVRGGRVRIDPTTASLPTIPSVYTDAGVFDEGQAHFIDQDGTTGCPSGRIPLRWIITRSGADKIRDGEREHCADFQLAFDLSLRRFADAVNAIASAHTTFASQASAERAVARHAGVAPANWSTVFNCLARKTLTRDRNNDHLPRPSQLPPRLADNCAFARMIISDRSLPRIGQTPSSGLVQGCGEHGSTAGGGSGSHATGPVPKPAWTNGESDNAFRNLDDEQLLQRSADGSHGASDEASSAHDASVDRALTTGGQALDAETRGFMEARFSHDFSRIRIHADSAAAASAAALHAHAYTTGHDIVFNHGMYAPTTSRGRHLLAHELAHTIQQDSAARREVQRDAYAGSHEPMPCGSGDNEQKAAQADASHPSTLTVSDGGQPLSGIDFAPLIAGKKSRVRMHEPPEEKP